MKKSIECLLSGLVLLSLIAFSVAHAEGNPYTKGAPYAKGDAYIGISHVALNYEEDFLGEKFKLKTPVLAVKLGVQVHDNLAIESRFGIGIGNEMLRASRTTTNFFGNTRTITFDRTIKLELMSGAYLRPGVNLGKLVHLYGILGFTEIMKRSVTSDNRGGLRGGLERRETIDSLSYGGGLDFSFSEHAGIHFEYMNYYDKKNVTIGGFIFGIQFRFF